ncbi:DUF4221 family protein [uncultured Roseivirga sp.]|uniref:DUF4221 family protein n=1 Tax=uncultured Roseivirga sp. TaxID=543088 RepID=UPI0030D99CD5
MLVLFSACSKPKQLGNELKDNLEQSQFSIEHGDKIISNRSVFTKLIGEDSLLYYEYTDRAFYIFDLKSRVLNDFLKFEIDGPNSMEEQVLSFDKVGDQYAILSSNYISFSDKNGQILKRKRVNQFLNNMDDPTISKTTSFKVINENQLYLSQSPRAVIAPFKYSEASLTPIFAIYHVNEDSIEHLPIYSPEETLINDETRGFYSSISQHFFILNNNCIVFNFQFSPSIYRYSLKSKQLTQFDGKTTRFPEATEPFPANKYRDPAYLVKHLVQNGTRFSNIEYDAENDIYIRYASKKTFSEELKKSNYELYLQVFDSDFNNIIEQEVLKPGKPEVYLSNGFIYMIGASSAYTEEDATKFTKFDLRQIK